MRTESFEGDKGVTEWIGEGIGIILTIGEDRGEITTRHRSNIMYWMRHHVTAFTGGGSCNLNQHRNNFINW